MEGRFFFVLISKSAYVLQSQSEPNLINSSRHSNNSGGLGAALSIRTLIVRMNSIVLCQCYSDLRLLNSGNEFVDPLGLLRQERFFNKHPDTRRSCKNTFSSTSIQISQPS